MSLTLTLALTTHQSVCVASSGLLITQLSPAAVSDHCIVNQWGFISVLWGGITLYLCSLGWYHTLSLFSGVISHFISVLKGVISRFISIVKGVISRFISVLKHFWKMMKLRNEQCIIRGVSNIQACYPVLVEPPNTSLTPNEAGRDLTYCPS